ncbi:formate/nitrite transporter family protein [Loktanella sp. SALINAS62]|uniref:formate/nitrite transporter family protein n=1 Tax=Loktanella sp. SALINAS62 TaxID=2706124 RepID=UPI001B8B8D00|nr:formate/nitrite transporter family protein [Loktanella sp. SALINAS62]MBS1303448.1 formate/nitrite transporter family protein [Loktanella sp. SALINAS62]
MPDTLDPGEIFEKAAKEGERRLNQKLLELLSTGFIAGFTIVFGIIALAIVEALAKPALGDLSKLLGALAFGIGLPFLILGRAELFSENFFDPIAAAFRSKVGGMTQKILRLWVLTLILNLVGGGILVLVVSVDGALPPGAHAALKRVAEEIANRSSLATLMRAIIGGALVALLSYLVIACRDSTARILLAYVTGVLLALGPFEHGVVTMLHLSFGVSFQAEITWIDIARIFGISIVGNLLGGVGLVTMSHAAQAKGAS